MGISPEKELDRFLAEDIGKGDITSGFLPRRKITATIITKQNGIIAGVQYAKKIFASKGCSVKILKKDGSTVKQNQKIIVVRGLAKHVLSCERTALNLLSRMSGIATETNKLVKKVRNINSSVKVYSTRKTAPGLRFFDKEAVKIGGGHKHRMGLDDMVMIKDNHLAVEEISSLLKKVRKKHKIIEIEVENTNDAILAAQGGAKIIMLDNFIPSQITKVIDKLSKLNLRRKVKLEASGGINSKNIQSYAATGVDMISIGKITHSVSGLDLSLEVN
ncbi:MAG: putative nicotinate-nucleotide pyrophosphorylase [Nitrosopumilales archaeon]|nr:MAG: putative nicotinate-nucleotide pyrophosphorylase [Nitrosopumilales archaeon]